MDRSTESFSTVKAAENKVIKLVHSNPDNWNAQKDPNKINVSLVYDNVPDNIKVVLDIDIKNETVNSSYRSKDDSFDLEISKTHYLDIKKLYLNRINLPEIKSIELKK